MKILKFASNCLFAILIVFAILVVGVLLQSYRFWFAGSSSSAEVQEFVVEEGSSFKLIAQDLKDQEIIKNKFWFGIYARLDGSARDLKAGSFELTPGMNYAKVVDVLMLAELDEVQITIPEGYTLDQIGEVVMANFDVTAAQWGTLTGMESSFEDHEFVLAADKPDNVDLEGYLFPDTYRFFKEATAEEIIEKMLDTMQARVDSAKTNPPAGWTLHEVLTLSSIVEREVRGAEDKALVADLFLRRLDINMALQADSTVNYITGNDTPAISLTDRDIDSLYNTYKYPGLPPGPISNPGLDSIKAVLSPTPNSYLFFLTTPEGEVIYSLTHDGHVVNKQKYLR